MREQGEVDARRGLDRGRGERDQTPEAQRHQEAGVEGGPERSQRKAELPHRRGAGGAAGRRAKGPDRGGERGRESGRARQDGGASAESPREDGAEGEGEDAPQDVDEEGREVVHVLGRRTSVGRTPDNDLQIDSRSVSRHHAVILVGPVHSIIEDLNSTNGVYVNGRRITRNTLKDGDTVVFGQVHYRFAVRKSGDKT